MGKPKKRVSPRVANQVNREYDTLIVLCIIAVVKKVEASLGMQFIRSSMLGSKSRSRLSIQKDIP
jgi:hypothetical protein